MLAMQAESSGRPWIPGLRSAEGCSGDPLGVTGTRRQLSQWAARGHQAVGTEKRRQPGNGPPGSSRSQGGASEKGLSGAAAGKAVGGALSREPRGNRRGQGPAEPGVGRRWSRGRGPSGRPGKRGGWVPGWVPYVPPPLTFLWQGWCAVRSPQRTYFSTQTSAHFEKIFASARYA